MLLKTFSGLYLTGLALTARCRQQQRRKSLGGETTIHVGNVGSVIGVGNFYKGNFVSSIAVSSYE